MSRRQTTIGREGWLYLFLAVVVFGAAMFKGINLLLLLAGMLLGPIVINWRMVNVNLRALRIRRRLPKTLSAGDTLSVGVQLANPRPKLGCWDVTVEEQIQRVGQGGNHGEPSVQARVLFPFVPAGQRRKATYRGCLPTRGQYRLGPLRVSTQFPFGLFSRTIVVDDVETIMVLPRLGRLTHGWAARHRETIAGADRGNRRAGVEGDFFGVREWRGGDGRRLIHWRRSARLDKLVVRQFEQPHNRDLAVILDLWEPKEPKEQHRENVELAVSLAATVLTDLCRKGGSNVFLALTDAEPQCFEGPTSAVLLQSCLEQLATIEARSDECLPRLLEHAMRRIAAGVETVLISTRAVDLSRPSWLANLEADPTLHDRARPIRCVDTSSDELWKYYRVE